MTKFLSLVAVAGLALGACGPTSPVNVPGAEKAAIDCAHQNLGQTVEAMGVSLLMTVASILFDGGTNWRADLTALEAHYTPAAVKCAALVAEALFRPAAGSGSGLSTGEQVETPHDRAVAYTAGVNFKK